MACRASPWRSRYSPGAQNEVLIWRDKDLRQPRLAHSNSDSCKISLFRCIVMSERSSSGKSFKSCWGRGREKEKCGESGLVNDFARHQWHSSYMVNCIIQEEAYVSYENSLHNLQGYMVSLTLAMYH